MGAECTDLFNKLFLKQAFTMIDQDRDGLIGENDLAAIYQQIGESCSQGQICVWPWLMCDPHPRSTMFLHPVNRSFDFRNSLKDNCPKNCNHMLNLPNCSPARLTQSLILFETVLRFHFEVFSRLDGPWKGNSETLPESNSTRCRWQKNFRKFSAFQGSSICLLYYRIAEVVFFVICTSKQQEKLSRSLFFVLIFFKIFQHLTNRRIKQVTVLRLQQDKSSVVKNTLCLHGLCLPMKGIFRVDQEITRQVLLGLNPDPKQLKEMLKEAPGQLNFTHFLTLFGEKMHGKELECHITDIASVSCVWPTFVDIVACCSARYSQPCRCVLECINLSFPF